MNILSNQHENSPISSQQSEFQDYQADRSKVRKSLLTKPNDYHQNKKREAMNQIQQIIKNTSKTYFQNKQLYKKIIQKNIDFNFNLFIPSQLNISQMSDQCLKSLQKKHLFQLDKLYEQNCNLQKQLSRLKFIQQNQQKQKKYQYQKHTNNFIFLRNIWKKDILHNQHQPQDIIQRINKKVGMIRNSINQTIKEQQNQQSNLSKFNHIQQQYIIQSSKYQRLLNLYQRTSMQLEFIKNNQNQHKQVKIKENNQALTKKLQILQFKLKQSQTKRLQNQQKIINLQKQLSRLTKQLETHRKQNMFSNVLNHQSEAKVLNKQTKAKVLNKQPKTKVQQLINFDPQSSFISLDISLSQFGNSSTKKPTRQALHSYQLNKLIKTQRPSLLKRPSLTKQFIGIQQNQKYMSTQPRENKENCPFELEMTPIVNEFPQDVSTFVEDSSFKIKFIRTRRRDSIR